MRMDYMKKFKIILLITLLMSTYLATLSAQELDDIEILSLPLQEVYETGWGLLLNYTNTEGTQTTLYIPSAWLQASRNSLQSDTPLRATRQASSVNIAVPTLKVTFVNGQIKKITVLIPKKYTVEGIPDYKGTLSDEELKSKFEQQENTSLMIE